MIRYLLLLHLSLAALYCLYRWRLHRLPHFRLNRIYLLLIPLLSLFLPLLKLPVSPRVNLELAVISEAYWEPLQTGLRAVPVTGRTFPLNLTTAILSLYALGLLGQLMRSGNSWFRAYRLLRQAPYARRGHIRWYRNLPFSCTFFGKIYLGKDYQALGLKDRQFLLRHEAVHARLGHSWDLLWLSLFRVVAWCNPFAHKLFYSAQAIHEFQADQVVAPAPQDFAAYARLLLKLHHNAPFLPITAFHSHPLNERVMMLKQNLTPNRARTSAYLLSLPLLAILLGASTFRLEEAVKNAPLSESGLVGLAWSAAQDSDLPTLKPVQSAIVSGFGMRMHPVIKENRMHQGIDFDAPMGTPVLAAGSGTVKAIEHLPETYGNLLIIDHGNGYLSRYAHLSEVKVKAGQVVKQGDEVALTGDSGMSKVPHLHFEILYQNKFIDPETLLK